MIARRVLENLPGVLGVKRKLSEKHRAALEVFHLRQGEYHVQSVTACCDFLGKPLPPHISDLLLQPPKPIEECENTESLVPVKLRQHQLEGQPAVPNALLHERRERFKTYEKSSLVEVAAKQDARIQELQNKLKAAKERSRCIFRLQKGTMFWSTRLPIWMNREPMMSLSCSRWQP